jgi:Kef-type K+ transport system membrane component KefB
LAILLLGAKIGGAIFNKLNQPSLVGELLAGIVLGSSILGIVKTIKHSRCYKPVRINVFSFTYKFIYRLEENRE